MDASFIVTGLPAIAGAIALRRFWPERRLTTVGPWFSVSHHGTRQTSRTVSSTRAALAIAGLAGTVLSTAGEFDRPPRIDVRVVSVRGDGAEVSGVQVIDAADQLELVHVRLIWTHAAIAGWLSDGPA